MIYNSKLTESEFRIDKKRGYLVPYITKKPFEISEIILPQSDNFENIKIVLEKKLGEKFKIKRSDISIVYEASSFESLEAFLE